jgi:hypothetical protein
MASGSFEIDSYSWFRSLPLSNCVNAYPQGTMFAVGECAFMKPYTFYQYQSSVGATDTSTLSNALTSTNSADLISTTTSLMSSIDYNRRQIVSTIPLTRWISSGTIETYPFNHNSTILNYNFSTSSTIQSSITYQFASSGLYGYITSNVYPSCAPYSLFSTIPVLASTFTSTTVSSITSNFVSTLPSVVSSIVVPSEIFDFKSTIRTSNYADLRIIFSNVWITPEIRTFVESGRYDVFVDYQYSIYVSTTFDSMTWVSTLGRFGYPFTVPEPGEYRGVNTATRVGNLQYSEIHVKQMFSSNSDGTSIVNAEGFNSNFYPTVLLQSSIHATGTGEIFVDIFSPGANNYTFTLVPR